LLRRAAATHRADFWVQFQLANLLDRKRPEESAEAAGHYRAALAARPGSALALYNLGVLLLARKDLAGAERAFRQAIRIDPNFAIAHNNLGLLLRDRKELAGAEQAFRQALRADPNNAKAHYCLGVLLYGRKELAGAEKEYREAIRIDPNLAPAHTNLGYLLYERRDLAGAEKEYREAIRCDPDYAKAHCNLGHTLRGRGRFRGALAALRRGHELGSRRPGWRYPSGLWVKQAERLAELDARLPAVLAGEAEPASAAEAAELGRLCRHPSRRRYAAAARFHAEALAPQPGRAEIPAHRYDAPCAAALAGCARGAGAAAPAKLRHSLRKQAALWLRADLARWARLEGGKPADRAALRQALWRWPKDPDLAGLRDEAGLAELPAAERQACRAFWADVAALLRRLPGQE
jgi:tetratricopeptide (TPR) repeat protein